VEAPASVGMGGLRVGLYLPGLLYLQPVPGEEELASPFTEGETEVRSNDIICPVTESHIQTRV
jgi:hypothetical protein